MEAVEMYNVFRDASKGTKVTNVNELVNLFLDNRDNYMSDVYFGAIMMHYWPKINRMYKKSIPYATFEDAYDWMIEAIMKAVNLAPWRDENDKLFTDENAPDKVINRIVICVRANWFQAQNRFSRKINMNILSTDAFQDQFDGLETINWTPVSNSSTEESNPVYGIVRSLFNSMNYEKAFVLDIVLFDGCESEKDIVDTFRGKLDKIYLEQFSQRYTIDLFKVEKAATYIKMKSTKELKDIVAARLKEIRTQTNIKEWVRV